MKPSQKPDSPAEPAHFQSEFDRAEATLKSSGRRRERKRRLIIFLGAVPLLAILILGVLAPIISAIYGWYEEAAERRYTESLYHLNYPSSVAEYAARVQMHHRSGMTVFETPLLPLNTPSSPDVLTIQSRAGFEGDIRRGPDKNVVIEIASSRAGSLPESRYSAIPLVLTVAGERHSIYSTRFEAEELAKFRAPGQNALMVFSIPTPLFLKLVGDPDATGQLGDYAFTFPESTRLTLREIAATLRPPSFPK